MKRTSSVFFALALLALTACGCGAKGGSRIAEDPETGYGDIVSFIVQGFQCRWDGISPEDKDLSPVYTYLSPYAGHAEQDIDGDGIRELLIGDQFEDGTVTLYDIFTVDPRDGSLIHLAKGGERDTFMINGNGVIVESGSNSASDSFRKGYVIRNGRLSEVRGESLEGDALAIGLERFSKLAKAQSRICGGYTAQREPNAEELELFRNVTKDNELTLSPLSVSTQVVAGLNYKFYCRYEAADDSGHCYVTIYKPLNGEARITGIEKL